MARKYYTYKITDASNGKVYIGSTTLSPKIRWKQHLRQVHPWSTAPLYEAMHRHGYWMFKMEPMGVHATRDDMLREETALMMKYHSFVPSGYNRIASMKGFSLSLYRMLFPHRITPAGGVRHRAME